MITPRIVQGKEKHCIGIFLHMNLVDNRTTELWSEFMPRIKEISNRKGNDFISLQEYPPNYHTVYNPTVVFKKWALAEVSPVDFVPTGMEVFTIESGLFAVFDYKGIASNPGIFEYIYADWLPNSGFILDDRPHFEVLGDNYKNNDSDSEEEIWIPIKKA